MPSSVPSHLNRAHEVSSLQDLAPVKAGELLRFIREEVETSKEAGRLAPYEVALRAQLDRHRDLVVAGVSETHRTFTNFRTVDTFFELAKLLYRHGSPSVREEVGKEMRTILRELPASQIRTIPTNTYSKHGAAHVLEEGPASV